MHWISENYQPILVMLPASLQVLPMRGELIIVILRVRQAQYAWTDLFWILSVFAAS